MDLKAVQRRQLVVKLGMISTLLFLIFTAIAMFAYPGGTRNDPTTDHYQFFFNFFSDLGLTKAHNGESKWVSLLLFSGGLGLAGAAFIAFFAVIPKWFQDDPRTKLFARIGSVFGMISAASMVGIALTPADILLDAHLVAVKSAMVTFQFAAIFYAIAIFRRKDFPNAFVIVYGVFSVILIYYNWLLFFGPPADTNSGLIQHCAGQKVLVYSMSLTLIVQSWGLLRIPEKAR